MSQSQIDEYVSYDPCIVGDFHNFSLEKVIVEVPDNTAPTPEIGINLMKDIYVDSYNEYKKSNTIELDVNNIVSNDLLLEVTNSNSSVLSKQNVKSKIDELAKTILIDNFEKDALYKMMDNMNSPEVLEDIKQSLEDRKYDYSAGKGVISRGAICLAISSVDYWSNSLHNAGQISTRSPAHVDAGGFVVGAAVTALAQDDLGWDDVPNIIAGGVLTGVLSSAGAASRIGKWLFGG